MEIFSVDRDEVVGASVALGRVNYEFALQHLFPLVDRLDIQRNVQNPRFYERLERDIIRRCLMPPITLAFVVDAEQEIPANLDDFSAYVAEHLTEGFILDGIQRLNTLSRASSHSDEFPGDQSLFLNVILCPSVDNLLYRMITLNNGQRPMTARHQVEILTSNAFEFDSAGLVLTTEKEKVRGRRGLFKRSDFELAYMAFLSNSIAIDSQKLIQEKLDELLANKILERDPSEDGVEFGEVMSLISKFCNASPRIETWFKVNNNLIGFASAIRSSYSSVSAKCPQEFEVFIEEFEQAFRSFDVSKIKLGRARRMAVAYVIGKFPELENDMAADLMERLTSVID